LKGIERKKEREKEGKQESNVSTVLAC